MASRFSQASQGSTSQSALSQQPDCIAIRTRSAKRSCKSECRPEICKKRRYTKTCKPSTEPPLESTSGTSESTSSPRASLLSILYTPACKPCLVPAAAFAHNFPSHCVNCLPIFSSLVQRRPGHRQCRVSKRLGGRAKRSFLRSHPPGHQRAPSQTHVALPRERREHPQERARRSLASSIRCRV